MPEIGSGAALWHRLLDAPVRIIPKAVVSALIAIGMLPGTSVAQAQSESNNPALEFRVTGEGPGTAASAKGEPLVTVEYANFLFNAFKDGQFPEGIDASTFETLKAALSTEPEVGDAIEAVRTKLGDRSALLLRRFVAENTELKPAVVARVIPVERAASGPGVLLIDSEGRAGREDPANWSATLYIQQSGFRCTATLIGPRVLLTAAHCLRTGASRVIGVGDQKLELICAPHPSFRWSGLGTLLDYALCHLSEDFPRQIEVSPGVRTEHVEAALATARREGLLSERHILRLEGHVNGRAGAGDDDAALEALSDGISALDVIRNKTIDPKGTLATFARRLVLEQIFEVLAKNLDARVNGNRLVKSVIVQFERLSVDRLNGRLGSGVRYARRVLLSGYGCVEPDGTGGNDGQLRAGLGRVSHFGSLWLAIGRPGVRESATLCQGDSGGAAYRLLDDDAYGRRVVVGVNARNLRRGRSILNQSFVAKTSSRSFVAFLNQWRRSWGFPSICGVDRHIDDLCHK